MRRVVVTGASSGIGLCVAEAFLANGDAVVAQYRSGERAVRELAQRHPGRVEPVQADLGDEEGCSAVARSAGTASILVHSAGIWNDGPIRALTRQTLEEIYRVNTFSAYYLVRDLLPGMASGSIVFIGSTAGERGEPGHSHYAGSKAALWGLVQSLAQELAPSIRVNLVSPGWVRTPMAEETFREPGRYERIIAGIPLRRVAECDDVVSAVMFLADERQRHLTGVDLPVSGGALLPLARG